MNKSMSFRRLLGNVCALFLLLCFSCKTEIVEAEKKSPVSYRVSYMQQNVDDDGYTEKESLVLEGLPGEMTAAPSKSYEGFSLREEIKNLVIAEDSSTVVEIFYDRLIFEITFSSGDGVFLGAGEDGENLNELRKTFRYGQEIVPPEPFREGYAAVWPDFDSADENQTYVPEWRGCDGVKFHVRHFLETLDGDFEEIEESSEELEGTSGTTTSFDEDDKKSFEGFDFKEVLNAVIKGGRLFHRGFLLRASFIHNHVFGSRGNGPCR